MEHVCQSSLFTCRVPLTKQRYFHSPAGNWLGLIAASLFLPGIVFGFPADWIAARWGRRWAIYVGSILIIIGGIWNGLAQNAGQFMGGKC